MVKQVTKMNNTANLGAGSFRNFLPWSFAALILLSHDVDS